VRRVDGVADPALDFDADHERVEEFGAGDGTVLRQGEDRRGNRTGRMDDGLEVRVVEVEHVRADAVHQRRVQNVHPFATSEH